MIKGIAFDKDGTLLEYEDFWCPVAGKAIEILLKNNGFSQTFAEKMFVGIGGYDGISGLLCHGTYAGITEKFNEIIENECGVSNAFTVEEVAEVFENCTQYGEIMPTCDNIKAVFQKLRANGYKIAVITSDNEIMTRKCLEKLGIADCFDALYTDNGVEPPKPDPYYMNRFCDEFSLAPSEAAMVGDTMSDMNFAKNSGVMAIGVAKKDADKKILITKADKVVYDISGVIEVVENVR